MYPSKRAAVASVIATLALSGCYVVPVAPDGTAVYPAAAVAVSAPYPVNANPLGAAPVVRAAAVPTVLQARLYPANDVATQTGMLAGTVTNLMTGKGRFQLEYGGETLVGEATRTPGDQMAGIANAYGNRGTYMSCAYRMSTPYQGTGSCSVSNGASYQVHLGS
jgi:hypothetical protein